MCLANSASPVSSYSMEWWPALRNRWRLRNNASVITLFSLQDHFIYPDLNSFQIDIRQSDMLSLFLGMMWLLMVPVCFFVGLPSGQANGVQNFLWSACMVMINSRHRNSNVKPCFVLRASSCRNTLLPYSIAGLLLTSSDSVQQQCVKESELYRGKLRCMLLEPPSEWNTWCIVAQHLWMDGNKEQQCTLNTWHGIGGHLKLLSNWRPSFCTMLVGCVNVHYYKTPDILKLLTPFLNWCQ